MAYSLLEHGFWGHGILLNDVEDQDWVYLRVYLRKIKESMSAYIDWLLDNI